MRRMLVLVGVFLSATTARAQTPAPVPVNLEPGKRLAELIAKSSGPYAGLLDVAAFNALEGQTALAADEAYALIRNLLPVTSP